MHIAAAVLALVAAGIHAWFFVLESLWFMRPSVHRRFGLASEEQARVVRSFAYNQGFYNLFLAVGAALGVALSFAGNAATGLPIMLFACGSMVAAGVVLVTHNRAFARAAAIQVVPPLAAIAAQVLLG
jgi:putative membrane protein